MITINITGVDKVTARLKGGAAIIEDEIAKEQSRIAIDLQSYIKEFKLSGQVLKNRTGNLRRAIAQRVEVVPGQVISAIVGVEPNATKYAAIHEFGGQVNVPAVSGKLMVFQGPQGTVFTKKHKAFSFQMPERSYLRSSLAEKKREFYERIGVAVQRGVARI